MELRERGKQQGNEEKETLKEKLRLKWNTRDFTPKEHHSNLFGMNFFFIMAASLLIESLFFLVPHVFPDSRWLMSLVILVMLYETSINWHRSYFDTANYVKPETKQKHYPEMDDTPNEWIHCITCQVRDLNLYKYCVIYK